MEKKRLLYVVESFGGGVFSYLCELCGGLSERYDIYVAYSLRQETPADFTKYFPENIKFIKLENFGREIQLKSEIKAVKELKQIISKVEPHVVHLHSTKAGVIGRLVLWFSHIPVFYTAHGYSFFMADAGKAKRLAYKMIEKICAMSRCITVACSKNEYETAKKLSRKSLYVNNGINIKSFDKLIENCDKESDGLTVYTLGRICHHKNPRLFNQIAEHFPNIRFVWIGDGEDREELKSSNITVAGWLDRDEAVRMAAGCDVFLMTTMGEGLSLSLLESMYMGKVCIVSNVSGNCDVIRDGENGFLCTGEEDYVKALEKVINGDDDLDKLRENAKNDVIKLYNTDKMCAEYSNIYDGIKNMVDIVKKSS